MKAQMLFGYCIGQVVGLGFGALAVYAVETRVRTDTVAMEAQIELSWERLRALEADQRISELEWKEETSRLFSHMKWYVGRRTGWDEVQIMEELN